MSLATRRRATRRRATVLAILLTGCATAPVGPQSSLAGWLEHDLTPHLVRELSGKPRFRGERIALVAMRGARADPRPPRLVERIRQRLEDRLVATPGVAVAAGGGDGCAPPRYRVALELVHGEFPSQFRVRALDRDDGTWVAGFGRTWSGRLSADEHHLASRPIAAATLRGTRETPWHRDEHDLAATALAAELRCELLRGAALPAAVRLAAAQAPSVARLQRLTARHLEAAGALRLDGEGRWTLSLSEEAIEPGITQLWATLRTSHGGPSLAASTYLRADEDRAASAQPPERIPPPLAAPPLPQLVPAELRRGCRRVVPGRTSASPAALDSSACVALHASAGREGQLEILSLHSRTGLRRLTCAPGTGALRTPRAGSLAGRQPGDRETFYALAYRDAARGAVAALLADLPAECDGLLSSGVGGAALARWLDGLEAKLPARDSAWSGLRVHYGTPTRADGAATVAYGGD